MKESFLNVVTPSASPVLLSRRQILDKPGLYRSKYAGRVRFLVPNKGTCLVIGDVNPLYVSGNYNLDEPEYVEALDEIVEIKITKKEC